MSIASSTGPSTSLLQSVLDAQAGRQEMDVALLKKNQDLMKAQGHAMIDVLEQAGTAGCSDGCGQHLDTYA